MGPDGTSADHVVLRGAQPDQADGRGVAHQLAEGPTKRAELEVTTTMTTTKRYTVKKVEPQAFLEYTWKGINEVDRCDLCGREATQAPGDPLRVLRVRLRHPAQSLSVQQPDQMYCARDYVHFLAALGREHRDLVATWCRAEEGAG
jgi:hypothetical protein